MAPPHHNPGRPIVLEFPQETITAFSISALATYVLVPELNCAFDMGECPMDAVPLDRVFISHAHGDHTRCMLRHEALRRLMGMAPATYYVPEQTLEGFQGLSRAWKQLENVSDRNYEPPQLHPLRPGDVVWLHRQLAAKAFQVNHSLPSLGYTIFDVRKKLKEEFHGRSGRELAQLRKEGVAFEDEQWLPRLTYIGDSTIDTLYRERHVGESRILLIELTYLMEDERNIARKRGHTHLEDLLTFLKECPGVLNNQHIILKHFSMRYDRRLILHTLKSRLPKPFLERVHILV
ncbi:MAG: MBL fold metallo-hydrolase [SAR324 cluster bacterium]|nr:MBL fold metallo-hydrolase [SAR324 cluster bacterium]MCZ6843092.1 MBL fold metallo-hydrolase [SAR324 cluster bacterium]